MDKQREYVLRMVEERDIRFIRLWFTDVLGFLKSFAITPAELEDAFEQGMIFDGSAIEGYARVQEADMVAKPDPSTFQVLPGRPDSGGVARMFCDVLTTEGEPFDGDPRWVLRRNLEHAARLGFTVYVQPEMEFFLFGDANGGRPLDTGSFFDQTALDLSQDFRQVAIDMLEHMGISVIQSHPEITPSQHEIDLHAPEYTAVTNQWINSYKRLVPGFDAPTYICWAQRNRSAMVRVGGYRSDRVDVEVRLPDPAGNPYLAFAVLLAAGMKGIEEEYELPLEAGDNLYGMTEAERRAAGISRLPVDLQQALVAMEGSELVAEALGEHVFEYFLRNKRRDWEAYQRYVSPFERERYLPLL